MMHLDIAHTVSINMCQNGLIFSERQGSVVQRTGQNLFGSYGNPETEYGRRETSSDLSDQQRQFHLGTSPVHSTPRLNANVTIDREIINLHAILERIRGEPFAATYEETAKEKKIRRFCQA